MVLALLGKSVTDSHTALVDMTDRFESRDACEDVIKDFNNFTIQSAGEEMQIQIRYADTQEQKSLKQQTQAARQFRSAEYEFATQAWRQGRLPFAGSTDHANNSTNEFEQYLGTTGVPIQGQRWAQSAIRHLPGRSPLGTGQYNNASQQPSVQIIVASGSDGGVATSQTETGTDAKPIVAASTSVPHNSPVDSAAASEQE